MNVRRAYRKRVFQFGKGLDDCHIPVFYAQGKTGLILLLAAGICWFAPNTSQIMKSMRITV